MDIPEPLKMVPVDGQAAAPASHYTLTLSQQEGRHQLAATTLAEAGALVHDAMDLPCGNQPLLSASEPNLFGSQPDPFGSQPGGFGARQTDYLLPSSQDGMPGGWHGAEARHAAPVKAEPREEPAWCAGLGFGRAADLHSADWEQQQEQPLKLDPEDEAEYERQLAGGSQPTFEHTACGGCPWEGEHWPQNWVPQPQPQPQPQPWKPQPQVPHWQEQQVPQVQQQEQQPQPVPYAALESQLHQMFACQPAAAQQQPQPAGEQAAAGCGGDHLLLSPAVPTGASEEEPADDAAHAVAACPPKAVAAGSRKRKSQQAAGSTPPAKRAACKPAQQAAAAARGKGGSSSRQAARRGQASASASGSGSLVRCTAGRAIAKKPLQPRTPNEQQLQPALLVEAAASKTGAKQRKQQAQQGSGKAARRRQSTAAGGKARAAKAAPKQQAVAAAKPGAGKPAGTSGSSKAKAQAGSMGGKASRSKCLKGGSKAAAKPGGKAATSGSSGKGGAKPAAGSRKRKAGGSKRQRVSRPCTGNATGRRKGGMNVPPEKLWAYHMDLLGMGGKAELAAQFQTRTDSLSTKVQSFLRGMLGPKMRLTDETIMYQVGSAQSRPPSLSLDKGRLISEGITTFGAFATRYLEPVED